MQAPPDDASRRDSLPALVDAVYREHSRSVLATLIRLLGDFDRAEEALHDAFAAAVDQWPRDGVPHSPRSWLISVGRLRGIDHLRRRARHAASLYELGQLESELSEAPRADDEAVIEDDRLRLIFTCCHPALTLEAQVALTLREVCGLSTEAIASAFLTTPATLAQRIVRAKTKIRAAKIPYVVPAREQLAERLDAVLQVVYLVFNEGYSASSGDALTRQELSAEAIRVGRLLLSLLPEPEVSGLLALMLLHESRRLARSTADGELVLLEDQDRGAWHSEFIREGCELVRRALSSPGFGRYAVQAAIAAVHAEAPRAADTDWPQIVGLYDVLLRLDAAPVVRLNRAVAVAMRDGAESGLALVEALVDSGELSDYHLLYSTRAELCRRLGRVDDARQSYRQALELCRQAPEQRFPRTRLAGLAP
ncbi:MAG: RNA polymerase sigma factor [Polyangiaceae bacterium]